MKFHTNNLIINIDDTLTGYIPKRLRFRLINNEWETQEISMIQHLPANSTVLELGGCLGVFSGVLNKKLSDQHKHIVLEANPDLMTILNQVKIDNDLLYTPINAMLGTISGQQSFYKHPSYALSSCSKKHADFYIECLINQYTINELENKYNMIFDTICMDIEGGEYVLYQEDFFSNKHINNIKYLLIEMHSDKFAPNSVTGSNLAKTLDHHLRQIFTLIDKKGQTYFYQKV